MSFLLDTNVISEWVKPKPNAGVIEWMLDADEDRVFLSVVTLAEIRHGIELLPSGARRQRLTDWLDVELPDRFQGRLIEVNRGIADSWGVCMARARLAGITLNPMDAFIAATAKSHGFALVTRNISDFRETGIKLVNPWK